MRITKSRLHQIIKEEITRAVRRNGLAKNASGFLKEMHGMSGGHRGKPGASSDEIADKVDFYTSRAGNRMWMSGTYAEYKDMASGGDADGIRGEYYRHWNDSDFQRVIDAVESVSGM